MPRLLPTATGGVMSLPTSWENISPHLQQLAQTLSKKFQAERDKEQRMKELLMQQNFQKDMNLTKFDQSKQLMEERIRLQMEAENRAAKAREQATDIDRGALRPIEEVRDPRQPILPPVTRQETGIPQQLYSALRGSVGDTGRNVMDTAKMAVTDPKAALRAALVGAGFDSKKAEKYPQAGAMINGTPIVSQMQPKTTTEQSQTGKEYQRVASLQEVTNTFNDYFNKVKPTFKTNPDVVYDQALQMITELLSSGTTDIDTIVKSIPAELDTPEFVERLKANGIFAKYAR